MIGPPADTSDILYLSSFSATDPLLLLDGRDGRILVVPDLELGRARKESRGVRVMSLSALFADRRAPTIFDAARALLQREGIGEVRVSRWFPAAGVSALRAGRIEVSVVDGALVPERECKTPREVKLLMESQRTAARAMRRALERIRAAEIGADGVLREGRRRLCSEAVREDIERTAAECGGLCVDTIVAGGVQAANPHEQGSGPLRAGEAIVLDIFPRDRHSGY